MSSLNPVYTVGRQIEEVLRLHNRISPRRGLRAGAGAARGGAHPRPRGAAQAVSAPALRRPAAAGDDRHRARQPPRRADRRRADHRARRDRAGADPDLLRELKASHGMSMVLITHDLTIVQKFSDYVYVMQHGGCASTARPGELFARPATPTPGACSPPSPRASPTPSTTPARRARGQGGRRRLHAEEGTFFKPVYACARRRRRPRHRLPPLRDPRHRRRVGLGQDHLRPGAAPPRSSCQRARSSSTASASRTRPQAMQPFRSRMQIVFQDPFSSLNPRLSVRQSSRRG